jgi:tetratricopeptide (TPR) repeat protein
VEHYNVALASYHNLKGVNIKESEIKADILFNRGQTFSCMSGVENFEKAIEDFLKADKKFDASDTVNKHKVAFNMGIVYRRLGLLKESLEVLAKAVTLNNAQAAT